MVDTVATAVTVDMAATVAVMEAVMATMAAAPASTRATAPFNRKAKTDTNRTEPTRSRRNTFVLPCNPNPFSILHLLFFSRSLQKNKKCSTDESNLLGLSRTFHRFFLVVYRNFSSLGQFLEKQK